MGMFIFASLVMGVLATAALDLWAIALNLTTITNATLLVNLTPVFAALFGWLWLKERLNEGREFILCGDWNIAHKNIDLKNWRSNQKNSGFLPEERLWLDQLFDEVGYVDAFRVVNQEAEQYTWWSNRGAAWDKNVGWRIDYHVVTPGLKPFIKNATIYKDERFSDHAPLIIDYDCHLKDFAL